MVTHGKVVGGMLQGASATKKRAKSSSRMVRAAVHAVAAASVMGAFMWLGCSAAQAQAMPTNWRGCTNRTLAGVYAFSASGYSIVAGIAQPKAVVQFTQFGGDGTFTVPAGTVSANGVISQIPSAVSGVYSIGPDCAGTYQFAPPNGPTFSLLVAPDGSKFWLIQTGPGAQVQQGNGERLSRSRLWW